MPRRNLPMAAARPSDLKVNNRMQILELFKTGAVYSVADIAREIGISRQTVMKAVQFFLEKGIIASEGKAASGSMGGKRAELFSLSGGRFLFNVLICPDYLYVSLFNFRCEVIDSAARAGIADMDADSIVSEAGRMCERLIEAHGIARADVRGVCVSTSGIVERTTNRLRFNSLFPSWGKDVPIAEKLSRWFDDGAVILTENVGKVCGSAYLHQSDALNTRGAAVFSSWGGVVACLMDHGHIQYGRDSLIGEIGHMTLAPDDSEVCACGGRGCFERQVSPARLRGMIGALAEDYPDSPLRSVPIGEVTIPDIFKASAAGDALAGQLSEYAGRFFAKALRNLTLVFNPDWVVFQGDYAAADERFCQALRRELSAFLYYNGSAGEPFSLRMDARSIKDLTTLGAYTLLIDRLFSDETTYS